MKVSYIIVTRSRREALLRTLGRISSTPGIAPADREVWIVDNASTDGSPDAVARSFPNVRLIRHSRNQGACARTDAVEPAQGEYLVFLDDDSFPVADAVAKSVRFLDDNPDVGAVTGSVLLPTGEREASAFPAAPICCALCVRRSALLEVGGFDKRMNRQGEELDLALRLIDAGYETARFEDIIYHHDKPAGGRTSPLVRRLDMRNNLLIAHRHLPEPLKTIYSQDWIQRYTAIARWHGVGAAAARGRLEAQLHRLTPWCARRQHVGPRAVERVFCLRSQAQLVADWSSRHSIRRVVIADLGKNIHATLRACRLAHLDILAIADNAPPFQGLTHRGLAVRPDNEALTRDAQGVVLSTINPAHVDRRLAQLRLAFPGPILLLWTPAVLCANQDDPGEASTPSRDALFTRSPIPAMTQSGS